MASTQIAQNVVREKGQTTCVHHKGQILNLYCETCGDVMCIKCLSSLHKSHSVCGLSEVTPRKKEELQNYLEKNSRAQIKKDIGCAETEMNKNSNNFDSLCQDVKTQSTNLKQAIDTKTENILSVCKQMEEGNINVLKKFRQELVSRLEYFDDELHDERKAVLRDGSDLQVHDTLEEVRVKANLPKMPILSTTSFQPNTNPQSYMDRYFGMFTTSAYRPQQYKFLTKPIEHACFELGKDIPLQAIRTTSAGEAWVCLSHNSRGPEYIYVGLFNDTGVEQQTIPWELPILDASVSPTTQNLWICTENHIYELDVSMKTSESLLRTQPSIRGRSGTCLCVTMDDHVLVGGKDAITKYAKNGRAVISTQPRQSGKLFVSYVTKLAECRVTRNVAAISQIPVQSEYDNYNVHCAVTCMDKDLKEIFTSNGKLPQNILREFNIDQNERMHDIQYDTAGNLIICCDSYLHVLSGSGVLLRSIPFETAGLLSGRGMFPRATPFEWASPQSRGSLKMACSLDIDGMLWTVWSGHGKYKTRVKRLQYCRENV